MSKKKRGIATFSTNIPQKDLHIEFDNNNQPCGDMIELFRSYYCMKVAHHFEYYTPMGKFPATYFDELWRETKGYWNIKTDKPKAYMKKWAMRRGTNWRSTLVQDYVRKGLNPCPTYPFMDPNKWAQFVKDKSSEEFLAKSAKAKAANAANKHGLRLGRSGWLGRKKKEKDILADLLQKYPTIKTIENKRSKSYIAGMAKYNKKTKKWELDDDAVTDFESLSREEKAMKADGSYYQNKEDPIIRVFGPEHGGRSRTVSDLIGYSKVHGGLIQNENSEGPVVSHGSDVQVNYPPIEIQTECELLLKVSDDWVKVADGSAWPSTSTMLHFKQITDGCVKVTVDSIVEEYKMLVVYNVTKTSEINKVEDLDLNIVQWPRYAIKLASQGTPIQSPIAQRGASPQLHNDDTMLSCYRPEMTHDENVAGSFGHISPQTYDENNMAGSFDIDEDDFATFQGPNHNQSSCVGLLLSVQKTPIWPELEEVVP